MTKFLVNGDEHELIGGPLTYEHIVKLAGLTGNPTMVYSSPRNGDVYRHGCMHKGQVLNDVTDRMRFTVCHTGNA